MCAPPKSLCLFYDKYTLLLSFNTQTLQYTPAPDCYGRLDAYQKAQKLSIHQSYAITVNNTTPIYLPYCYLYKMYISQKRPPTIRDYVCMYCFICVNMIMFDDISALITVISWFYCTSMECVRHCYYFDINQKTSYYISLCFKQRKDSVKERDFTFIHSGVPLPPVYSLIAAAAV